MAEQDNGLANGVIFCPNRPAGDFLFFSVSVSTPLFFSKLLVMLFLGYAGDFIRLISMMICFSQLVLLDLKFEKFCFHQCIFFVYPL